MDEIDKLVEKLKNDEHLDLCYCDLCENVVRSALREAQRMAYEDAAKRALAWEAPPKHSQGCCCPGCDRIGDARTDIAAELQALADSMKQD